MSYQPRTANYGRSSDVSRRSGSCLIWFGSGCVFGIIAGVLIVLAVATFSAASLPIFTGIPSDADPDIVVSVDERYLNTLVAQRVGSNYSTGVEGLTLTGLQVDLGPDNRMDLVPTFRVDTMFFPFDVNARVNNNITVQDNNLSINMIGDPQIGDLNISLDILPFDLKGVIRQAVDRINNELLIAEINAAARPSLESANFGIDSVTTNDTLLTLELGER